MPMFSPKFYLSLWSDFLHGPQKINFPKMLLLLLLFVASLSHGWTVLGQKTMESSSASTTPPQRGASCCGCMEYRDVCTPQMELRNYFVKNVHDCGDRVSMDALSCRVLCVSIKSYHPRGISMALKVQPTISLTAKRHLICERS